jgi:hypothetical protein
MRFMFIAPHTIAFLTGQTLIGARPDDPVLPERRRTARRRTAVPGV